jgi:hypothetical protein
MTELAGRDALSHSPTRSDPPRWRPGTSSGSSARTARSPAPGPNVPVRLPDEVISSQAGQASVWRVRCLAGAGASRPSTRYTAYWVDINSCQR